MKYSVIIVAAGKGARTELEYNKLFFKIDKETLIYKTLQPFQKDEDCEEIIMVVLAEEKALFEKILPYEKIRYTKGGSTRQESVYNGLKLVQSEYVMVHDGARPYLETSLIEDLKETLKQEDACLLMVPVVDTIKKVKDGYVVNTPLRSECYAAQTPQCFKTELLKRCHEKGMEDNFVASDDSQLVEAYGNAKVKVVESSYGNKKVTTKEDLL